MGFANKNNENLVMVSIKLQMRFRRSRGRPNSLFINPFVFSPYFRSQMLCIYKICGKIFLAKQLKFGGIQTRHDFYLCMSKETFVIFIIYMCYNLA